MLFVFYRNIVNNINSIHLNLINTSNFKMNSLLKMKSDIEIIISSRKRRVLKMRGCSGIRMLVMNLE